MPADLFTLVAAIGALSPVYMYLAKINRRMGEVVQKTDQNKEMIEDNIEELDDKEKMIREAYQRSQRNREAIEGHDDLGRKDD